MKANRNSLHVVCCAVVDPLMISLKNEFDKGTGYSERKQMYEPQHLELLYTHDRAFTKLDYHSISYSNCSSPDDNGIYACNNLMGPKNVSSTNVVYAALYFFYPCQEKRSLELSYDLHIHGYNKSRKCFELQQLRTVCWIYYNLSILPNMFGGKHQFSIETASMVVKARTNQCHKYVEEIFCRILLPECAEDTYHMQPCQSLAREVMLNACRQETHFLLFYFTADDGNMQDVLAEYYIAKFPHEKPCFNVSVTCDDPPEILHGTKKIQTDANSPYPVNTFVSYICDQNYELAGDSMAFCKYSGYWESQGC